jgi:hypothetical protein
MDIGIIKAPPDLILPEPQDSQRIDQAGRTADMQQNFHGRPDSLKKTKSKKTLQAGRANYEERPVKNGFATAQNLFR